MLQRLGDQIARARALVVARKKRNGGRRRCVNVHTRRYDWRSARQAQRGRSSALDARERCGGILRERGGPINADSLGVE